MNSVVLENSTLELYNYYRSSACFRVRIALNLKHLNYKTLDINLLHSEQTSEDYKNLNPQTYVPLFKDENGSLTQSLAIIEYLDELYPRPPLLPADPYLKAKARAFALTIAADIHPLNNLSVLNFLKETYHTTETQAWYQHWIKKGLTALEKTLETQPLSSFCFGEIPSIADICLIPQMYNARRFSCPLNDYPNLVRIDAHCQKQPAFMQAWPMEQKE